MSASSPARFADALGPGNRVHDQAREYESRAGHQKRRNCFNREPNTEIGRPPDQIKRGECDDYQASFRRGHEAMIISHSRDRANVATPPRPDVPFETAVQAFVSNA